MSYGIVTMLDMSVQGRNLVAKRKEATCTWISATKPRKKAEMSSI